jgi:hypothetical protein
MDLPDKATSTRSFIVPLLLVHPCSSASSSSSDGSGGGADETFRQLLARIKRLLCQEEGLEIAHGDLANYTRFTSPEGDIYLLDSSVRHCLQTYELHLVTDQHLKRKRDTDSPPPQSDPTRKTEPPAKRKGVRAELIFNFLIFYIYYIIYIIYIIFVATTQIIRRITILNHSITCAGAGA